MILRWIVGIILCLIGYYFVRKPQWPLEFIGRVDWAEKVVPGGSYSFYKLFGIILILLGFSAITNLYGNIINWFLGFIYH